MRRLWREVIGNQAVVRELRRAKTSALEKTLARAPAFELGVPEMELIGDWLLQNVPEKSEKGSRSNSIDIAEVIWRHHLATRTASAEERRAFNALLKATSFASASKPGGFSRRRLVTQFVRKVGLARARALLDPLKLSEMESTTQQLLHYLRESDSTANPEPRTWSLHEIWKNSLCRFGSFVWDLKRELEPIK